MSHYAVCGENEREFIKKHASIELVPQSCICKAHLIEAKRMWGNPEYIPKWKSSDRSFAIVKYKCLFSDCQEIDKLISPKFDTVQNMELAIGAQSTADSPLLLCPKHYTTLYRQLHATQSCVSCGIRPKQGTSFTRHSPNATLINSILSELNFDESAVHIQENDYVYNTCYKTHLAMLKYKDNKDNETCDSKKLMQLMESWKITIANDATDAITKAILHTVLYVADEIMHERAVLLPRASQVFLAVYTENSACQTVHVLEVGEGTIKYTTQWLLNQIILHLEPFINYRCIHKKFGTLLFRKGGDILTSLSWALGRAQLREVDNAYVGVGQNQNKVSVLREAGDIVNDLVHAEIAKSNSDQIYTKTDPNEMDIKKQINEINEELWAFLELRSYTNCSRAKEWLKPRWRHTYQKATSVLLFTGAYVLYKYSKTYTVSHSIS